MAQNLTIDPKKRDYVVVNGSPVPSDRIFESCYYPLLIPQGKWLYGTVAQGSLLYTLAGIKRSNSIEQLFASYSQAAIQSQVIGVGRATGVTVFNLSTTATGSSNQIEVIPSNTQLSNQLNFDPV